MRKGMFLRLALTNIKKNRGTYIPYMLSCMGCIAVLYIMMFIVTSPDTVNMRGGRDVADTIVSMGVFILGVFFMIFLLFCNSFLMKRRQKELGLYNVLGMEKRHISHLMLVETVFIGIASLAGTGVGILGSKLALLLLLKILRIPAKFGFYISWKGIKVCAVSYGVILVLTLLII